MSKNNNNLSKHYNKIKQTELTSEVYHIPAARKYGVQMIHQWVNKNFSAYEKELETALNLRNNYSIAAESSACSYDYMLIEHLLLIERYEEITEIDKTTIHQKYNDFTPASRQLSHKIIYELMMGITELYYEKTDRARSIVTTYDIKNISFGWKKYSQIMFYFLNKKLAASDIEKKMYQNTLEKIIKETGFRYLEDIYLKN